MRLLAAAKAAVRSLRRAPGNAGAVVLVLSAAAAASGLVEAVWDGVVARPLPYRAPGELVMVTVAAGESGAASAPALPVFGHEALSLREESSAFAGVAQWSPHRAVLGAEGGGRTIRVALLAPSLLGLLGVGPAAGRLFTPEEHLGAASGSEGTSPALLLGHDLWRSAFGSSPEVVGTEVALDGVPVRVVGVMPAAFRFPDGGWDGWMPMPGPEPRPEFGTFTMRASPTVARLAPGRSPAAAAEEAAALLQRLGERPDPQVRLRPLEEAATAAVRPTLEILRVGALFLLLAAALSVVGLRVSRALAERRESAIRRSLGAAGGDEALAAIVRILLVGTAVAALGGLLAGSLLPLLRAFAGELGADAEWGISPGVAGRGALLALSAVALAELPSVLTSLRVCPRTGPAFSAGVARGAGSPRPLARPFLAFGAATGTVLLIVAAVLAGSGRRLLGGAHGYGAAGLAQVTLDFGGPGGATLPFESKVETLDRLAARFAGFGGVEAVGYADTLPDEMQGDGWAPSETLPPGVPHAVFVGRRRAVSPGLFATLGMAVLRGRGFLESDLRGAPAVAVFDRRAVALSDRADPLGHPERPGADAARVVGVVPGARLFARREELATMYVPFAQGAGHGLGPRKVEVVTRFREEPTGEQLAALSRVPGAISPALRVLRVESVRARRIRELGSPVFAAFALGVFSLAGLLLAAVGAGSQVFETAAQSARSLAVRRALGGSDRRVIRDLVRGTLSVAGLGIAIGGFLGWVAARLVGNRVVWVETGEPFFYAAPIALVALTVVLAALRAGRRAVRGAPAAVLRSL